eukprot:1104116-Amphidinium_carterae.1
MASVASATTARKRSRKTGATNAMVAGLASGLASMSEQDHEENVQFVVDRLNDEDMDLAGISARPNKDGTSTLRKALAGDKSSEQGKELAHGCDNICGLRETLLWKLLCE